MGKFYFVTTGYAPNTAATNRYNGWIKSFSERGIDTDVVYFVSDRDNSKAPEQPHIRYHYYWRFLSFIKKDNIKNALFLFLYVYLFALKIKKDDIVYICGCDRLTTLLAKRKNVKVYCERTEHPEVSHFKVDNVKRNLSRIKDLSGVFVISQNLKDYFQTLGVNSDKIHVVNMTVDQARFAGIEKQTSVRYVAYCGNASNDKDGVNQLIRAFTITSQSHPDVKLYIIGPKPADGENFPNAQLAKDLGIEDKVIFTGVVKSEDMPQVLMNAEVLALDRPDNLQAKYGFPTKLGEYLLTGNPVVITRVGNIPLFLEDGVSALIAEPDNDKSFSDKLNWVLDHKEKAAEIGRTGKQVALKEFNSTTEADKIINVIFDRR